MTELTVVSDLLALLKLEPGDGETQAQFAERMVVAAQNLSDDDWGSLDQPTQEWVNTAVKAIQRKREVPLPEGIEAVLPATEAGAEATPKAAGARMSKKPVKPKKAPKPKSKAKPKKDGKDKRTRYAATDKIKVTVAENPFRKGTKCANWFAKIEDGMTVEQALSAGAPRNHIRWAASLGHIKVSS